VAITANQWHYRYYVHFFLKRVDATSQADSLSDVLDRMYQSQLGLEAALMKLTLLSEKQDLTEVGGSVRYTLWGIGENIGYIKQGLGQA